MVSKQPGKISLRAKLVGPKTAMPPMQTPRVNQTGGALFNIIKEGELTRERILEASREDLYHMLPVILSSIINIPMSFDNTIKQPLIEAFDSKVKSFVSLQQRFKMFLYSYYNIKSIKDTWKRSKYMPNVSINFNDDNSDEKKGEYEYMDELNDKKKYSIEYLDKDVISLLNNICDKVQDGTYDIGKEIKIKDVTMYDILGSNYQITSLKVKKIFHSNAKPILFTAFFKDSDKKFSKKKQICEFILKRGDDMRKDSSTMNLFRFCNAIWKDDGLIYSGYLVRSLLYTVVPMGDNLGVMEFISNCKALRDVLDYKDVFTDLHLKNLVATAAGSYIASLIVGARDRHFDNVLIRNDGTLFHIDFGYVMGDSMLLDTAKIAITSELYDVFGDEYYSQFIEVAANAYMSLRTNFNKLCEFAKIVFSFANIEAQPKPFFSKLLQMDKDYIHARQYIVKKLQNAPKALNTKIKNAVHGVATAIKN